VQRSHQFRSTDTEKLEEIREALGTVAMTVVSFYEVDYSYDQEYLTGSMERCRSLLQQLIKPHLTDKSSQRCDQVFDFLAYPKFLDSVFRYDSDHRPILGMLVSDLNKALDARRLWFYKNDIHIMLIRTNRPTGRYDYRKDDCLPWQRRSRDRDRWRIAADDVRWTRALRCTLFSRRIDNVHIFSVATSIVFCSDRLKNRVSCSRSSPLNSRVGIPSADSLTDLCNNCLIFRLF